MSFEGAVDIGEQGGQEFVVVAKFQKLRVCVFQKIDDGGGGVGFVVDQSGGPADHE